ncbi:MAG: phosphomannose isomerase type II C-terminal cupin domain [Candidatus Paceibacterota bacterium]|jgi:mannose-1-phosphate guanylyltransferase/mannose-6-phosphate isomerase
MKSFIVERCWGKFEQFTKSETTTVKIISINPNSTLSLQYHNHRAEFWRVLSGHPLVTIGENVIRANPGDEFIVKIKQIHRLATEDDAVQILEIAYDNNFDEEDIVRLEDKYGRVK